MSRAVFRGGVYGFPPPPEMLRRKRQEKPSGVYTMQETACDVATAHWTRVHNNNAVRAALAKARISAGYQREPLARCHETHFTGGVCGCICRSVWRRGRRSWCSCRLLAVISVVVVVSVAVRRLQRHRVSAHGMTNGTQELESRIKPVVELGQTGLDSWLVHDVSFAFRATK